MKKIKKIINACWLCLKYPFLYPRNRFSDRHIVNLLHKPLYTLYNKSIQEINITGKLDKEGKRYLPFADFFDYCVRLNKENNKLIITTHSPYILTSLNNAIFAKDVFNKQHKYIEELPENKMVSFEDISAYKLEEGNIISIRDEETRLINAYQIDDCSIQIDENFSKLSELMEQNND